MSEQAFIDAALSRGVIAPDRLHAALAVESRWTSVAGRLLASGVDRQALLEVMCEVTGLEPAPRERLASPDPVSLPPALFEALGHIGAVPLGEVQGKILLAVISTTAKAELSHLDLPPHKTVIALEQDAVLAAAVVEALRGDSVSLGDSVSAETLEGGIKGELSTMSVTSLARLLAPHKRDAMVLIELTDGTSGRLGFQGGRLVYATVGDSAGVPAALELAGATQGRFRVLYGDQPPTTNVSGFDLAARAAPAAAPAPAPVTMSHSFAAPSATPPPVDLPPWEVEELSDIDDEDDGPLTQNARPREPTPRGRPEAGDHAFVASEIAGFRVGALIGRGAGGLVHRATRISDGEELALKLILPERSTSAHFMQRAKRETTVQASLRHRNVVAVQSFGQAGELWYLASELVAGGPLSKKVRAAGKLPSALVALLVRDILAGVEHAHHNHVIHRDLKPGNVLLTTEGRAKLTDFGLARSLYDPFRTKPGVVMGTPQYMSPEQVTGREVDYRTDFFSIATIMFEMLTNTSPYKDENPVRTMMAVATGERPPVVDIEPTVLPLLESALEWLGDSDPERRPEKAALVLDRLDPLAYAVERIFPDAGPRFVKSPKETAIALRQEEAKLELARAERLLAQGAWSVPEASFAAWRAAALDENLIEAAILRDRIASENGYRFEKSEDPGLLALEDELSEAPKDAALLRKLVDGYREERNVPMLVRRLRRLARAAPDDEDAAAALSQMIGDPMGGFKRR